MTSRSALRAISASILLLLVGCGSEGEPVRGVSGFHVEVVKVNGAAPPTPDKPLPANRGDKNEAWEFKIEARGPEGNPVPFEGMVRLSVRPGAVMSLIGDGVVGRNIRVHGGAASGIVNVTAVYGPARLWAEDIGYVPAPPGRKPACSNGINDDPQEDVLIDYPADPGCAFADDDTETGGTFTAGISAPLAYALPRLVDVQGESSATPYPYEGIQINTDPPQHLVVTRVASDGFYVTDVTDQAIGYNHLYAYNFSTPANMRVCDRVVYLAGTVTEFFGFTELNFPSFDLAYPHQGDTCEVPEPALLDATKIADPGAMEKLESGLVRVQGYHVSANFGPKLAKGNVFKPDQSNCDLNGDGQVDFNSDQEGGCANACSADPECSEWTSYSARGNYKVSSGTSMILIQTGTVSDFDPPAHRGEVLDAVTGTLRNFSGGSLNWTIETRCPDDLVCKGKGCVRAPLSSKQACVRLRNIDDNDSESN